jgi:hypothetical protein
MAESYRVIDDRCPDCSEIIDEFYHCGCGTWLPGEARDDDDFFAPEDREKLGGHQMTTIEQNALTRLHAFVNGISKDIPDDLQIVFEVLRKAINPTTFNDAARPLIRYMAAHKHPHHTAIVDCKTAELLEGVEMCKIEVD